MRFDEFLDIEWEHALNDRIPLSIMMMDIDHFKLYNDNYGHPAGDQCLRQLAQALSELINRPSDLLARYGGEEFVAVMSNTGASGINFLSKMIQLRLEDLNIPHQYSPTIDRISLSIGGATIVPSSETWPGELLENADKALYRAKENGRNQFQQIDLREQS